MTSYMPASILNSELGHARELQELHTELGPFAFTTAGRAKTAAGAKQTSGKEKKAAQKAKRATAKKANAAGQAAAAAEQIPVQVAIASGIVVQNYANQQHLGQSTEHAHTQMALAHKQMEPAHVMSTTQKAKTGKKKKKPRKKHELPPDAQNLVYQKDQVHRDNLIKVLQNSNTQQEYAEALHVEFVRYAQEKLDFYSKLPPVSRSNAFFVKRAEHSLEKAKNHKPRTTFWPPEVFKKYKSIKQDCVYTISMIYSVNPGMDEKDLNKLRVAAIQSRNKYIEDLLKKYKLDKAAPSKQQAENPSQEDEAVKRVPQLPSMVTWTGVKKYGNEKKEAVLKGKDEEEQKAKFKYEREKITGPMVNPYTGELLEEARFRAY